MDKKLESVLVVYKKSSYQIYIQEHGDSHIQGLIEQEDPNIAEMMIEHQENQQAIQEVRAHLKARKIRSRWIYRAKLEALDGFDLVLSIGGDGTLLEAARKISDDTPLLGLNSSPSSSVGYLCACDSTDFEETLEGHIHGDLPTYRLSRIACKRNDEPLYPYALNDVLYTHDVPAGTARYQISLHDQEQGEEHRSSGVWISTAAGSTAAIHSAGGKIMPLQSRRLQYRVRELYCPPGHTPFQIEHGFLRSDEPLTIISQMRKSMLFIDGPWVKHRFKYNDRLTIERAKQPLVLLGDIERTRQQR